MTPLPTSLARAACLRPSTITGWGSDELACWADRAAESGVTALITKLDTITADVRQQLEGRGIQTIGSFSCYSDHRKPGQLAGGIRPVGTDGTQLPPIEWYTGLVPGDPQYDDSLVSLLRAQIRAAGVSTVFLDFLRWPGHWELESRAGGTPRPTSFDPGTLARFGAWLGVGAVTPSDALGPLHARWTEFRVATITTVAARLATVVRESGATAGAFLVPVPRERRRTDYGQDEGALASHIDVFAVMSYQQMMGLDAEGTLALTREVADATAAPVLAMVQTTADTAYSGGWDWGPPVDPGTVRATTASLTTAVAAGSLDGICCFPGEAALP